MKTSIFFFGVFTAGLLTDMQVDWQSYLWGFASAVSVVNIIWSLTKD